MIKLSSDLSLLRNKKTDVKKEPSSGLSSRSFAAKGGATALLVKMFIPWFYAFPQRWEPSDRPWTFQELLLSINSLICLFYFISIFIIIMLIGGNRKKVLKPFSVEIALHDRTTYYYLTSIALVYLLPPSCVPRIMLVLKSLVIIMDTFLLYNHFTCDDFKLENFNENHKMKLYESCEKNHGTKRLSIMESTSTCITMKNVGEEDLDVDFVIDRRTYSYREYSEDNDHSESNTTQNEYEIGYQFFPEYDNEFTQHCHAEGCKVPSGKVFKIVTTEYDAEDIKEDELCFVVPEYRVFGTNIDNYVVTTVDFKNKMKVYFDAQLTQKYETKRQRYMREKDEKNTPDVPKEKKKVKKTKKITKNKNDKEVVTTETKVDDKAE